MRRQNVATSLVHTVAAPCGSRELGLVGGPVGPTSRCSRDDDRLRYSRLAHGVGWLARCPRRCRRAHGLVPFGCERGCPSLQGCALLSLIAAKEEDALGSASEDQVL